MIDIRSQIQRLRICIIIPTYNNESTIKVVIEQCLEWTDSIIVVNDGSTDRTQSLIDPYRDYGVQIISYDSNRGKGYALRRAFTYALQQQYRYAISMDADGQHFASDIPRFINALTYNPGSLIIGSRNLKADGMPRGNTFANRFSNFWFSVQTLQYIPDTQTGYRLYPLDRMANLWWLTSRYEAELELLVYAAWHGIKLIPVQIHVYYPPQGERVSHFRPFTDFVRISILNTILCILAIIYGIPSICIHKLMSR